MKTVKNAQRRKFLVTAGVGGAGAAAALVTGHKAGEAVNPASEPGGESTTYRATEHVLKYYKTAEV